MAKPKQQRNKQFQEDWQRGLGNEDLGKKYGLSLGGVKALKQRLRAKDSSLYTEKRPGLTKVEKEVAQASGGLVKFASKPDKTISPQVDKSTSLPIHKRATYYLDPEIIRKIKLVALDRNLDTSALVREILSEWTSQQVDK